VITDESAVPWVVSCGNRSLTIGQLLRSHDDINHCLELAYLNGDPLRGSPFALHDMHAEVLSVRGLRRIYMEQVKVSRTIALLSSKAQESELMTVNVDGTVILKPKSWHLSISLPPCGRQTDYCREGLGDNRISGAKRYHENCSECKLRYKPGRIEGNVVDYSIAKRSNLSLSCSDKIMYWTRSAGGWMGRLLLSCLFPDIINEDIGSLYLPSLEATYCDDDGVVKACEDRKSEPIMDSKRFSDERFMKTEGRSTTGRAFVSWKDCSGLGPSIVYETINSVSGLLNKGVKPVRPKIVLCDDQYIMKGGSKPLNSVSRLSRLKLADLAKEILDLTPKTSDRDFSYNELKSSSIIAMDMLKRKEIALQSFILCGSAKILIKSKATKETVKGYEAIPRIYYFGEENYYAHLYEASFAIKDTSTYQVTSTTYDPTSYHPDPDSSSV